VQRWVSANVKTAEVASGCARTNVLTNDEKKTERSGDYSLNTGVPEKNPRKPMISKYNS
jgi:hypothetical protein